MVTIPDNVDPSSLPTRDGKPVAHGEEILRCNTCLYCRGEFWRGREKPPALCWQQDPEGPPAPQPVRMFQDACREYVPNPRGSFYMRVYKPRIPWDRGPGVVFVRDGESWNSGMWYSTNDPEYQELKRLKFNDPLR